MKKAFVLSCLGTSWKYYYTFEKSTVSSQIHTCVRESARAVGMQLHSVVYLFSCFYRGDRSWGPCVVSDAGLSCIWVWAGVYGGHGTLIYGLPRLG